ncbi:kinesin-like protein KIFC3 isoform X4 [Rana temporaria]|nr:kinesin-like protein KIFC3 isoform X4 [Rana temporaria]XP_040185187.1 kinesin-like protein KIFC3 isoform X4 [Rana temporaria]XP_040185188.1 kinesin-like protein KIFC3 isoform X4 [Rana temporaria]XP_040185189.1 kinesin-like protein KIFC3 isoform X4 [Rana temporaria]XP_040185190.1 kinesin-like protein KIFC3 isoform X4 [Rana temporaria]
MVGTLPQDVPKPPDTEGPQQRPPEGPGAPRPLLTRLQEMRASQGRRQLQGEPRDTTDLQIHLQRLKVRQDLRPTPAREERSSPKSDHLPEDSLPRRVALQERRALHMRLQEDRAKREERAFQKVQEERVLQEVREEKALQAKLQEVQEERVLQAKLQEVREERVLQAGLQEWQEKLEQKQKEHVDMCRKVQEMQRQLEEMSGLQQGGTDLEKHRDLLVSENGHLRQELQLLRNRLDSASNQEVAALEERLQRMVQEESERKALICALQREVQQKAERLAEVELRVRDSVRERVEEEERLNRRLREYQQQPQIKYVVQTVEVESGKMKAALSQAEEQTLYLQEQLDRHNRTLHEMKKQLQHEQQEAAKLRAQVALYTAELERVQAEMVQEFQVLQEEKAQAVAEAYDRAQVEMKAVHHSLDGVRRNLLVLQPALRTLTQDYNSLKRQVRDFPGLLSQAMKEARDEFSKGIKSVQDANNELLSKYRRELHLRKECHNQLVRLRGNIRVLTRVRPITDEDGTGPGAQNVVTFDPDDDGILHVTHKGKSMSFEMDKVFTQSATQEQVFTEVSPLITSCLDGYSVCILAYGQTGSGKTYSMEGPHANPGINQRALRLLLSEVSKRSDSWEHHLSVSMVEIYNESLRDLLGADSNASLDIKISPGSTGELYVPGLTQQSVHSIQDINKILEFGHKQRATEQTNLNTHSSRSHALLILTARGRETSTGICTTGKLYLVDLAGSERVSRSGAAGDRLREAQCINRSLSALGDVFSALRSNQAHIPYRNSKLTYLLQEPLSRDGKALLLLQVSPAERNVSESLCSLRFGDRVRAVELGAPSRKIEQPPSSSTETSESDTPSPRGIRNTSVRRKAPSSVRHRIGPP